MNGLDNTYGPGTTSRLSDVAALCRRAEILAARGRRWYDSDPELDAPKLAADSLVLKIGEAVRRLPQEFLAERRGEPTWRRAIGMRHRIAHDYDAVDYEIVWRVVSLHARDLRERIEATIADAESGDRSGEDIVPRAGTTNPSPRAATPSLAEPTIGQVHDRERRGRTAGH